MGNGRNPGGREILALAARVDIPPARARESLARIGEAVSKWPDIAAKCGVSSASGREIGKVLDAQVRQLIGR
jgi:serine/threonine-protein kinase HipA